MVAPEGFPAHQAFISDATPKLTGAFESALVLPAGRFHRATAAAKSDGRTSSAKPFCPSKNSRAKRSRSSCQCCVRTAGLSPGGAARNGHKAQSTIPASKVVIFINGRARRMHFLCFTGNQFSAECRPPVPTRKRLLRVG